MSIENSLCELRGFNIISPIMLFTKKANQMKMNLYQVYDENYVLEHEHTVAGT